MLLVHRPIHQHQPIQFHLVLSLENTVENIELYGMVQVVVVVSHSVLSR